MKYIDGLPDLPDRPHSLTFLPHGQSAFLRTKQFIARVSLRSGEIDWLVERSPIEMSEAARCLPRRIFVNGSDLWISEADQIVAEIMNTEDGGLIVSAWNAVTGSQLWEHVEPIPDAAEWEASPAWPGGQTVL